MLSKFRTETVCLSSLIKKFVSHFKLISELITMYRAFLKSATGSNAVHLNYTNFKTFCDSYVKHPVYGINLYVCFDSCQNVDISPPELYTIRYGFSPYHLVISCNCKLSLTTISIY